MICFFWQCVCGVMESFPWNHKLFCDATGVEVSIQNSSFLINRVDYEVLEQVQIFLPLPMDSIEIGFKYLGYFFNSNNYLKEDWMWFLKKVENKMDNWCHKWFSLSGRLILVKYVMDNIPMYSLSLEKKPKFILNKIR